MALLGWYAKQRMKYLIVFLLISLIFWYLFLREWKPFDTPFCYKEKCIIPTAYGKGSRGGNCFGRKCKAGNCVGEDCRAGDCSGFNCKAGDCYGLNCTPGRCNDPTCKKKTDNDKSSPTYGKEIGCVQGKCGDGRAYDIDRGKYYKFQRKFPENTTMNKQYCDTVIVNQDVTKSGLNDIDKSTGSKIWKPSMKIYKKEYYHKGLKPASYSVPKRGDGKPIYVQRDPIIDTEPSIYKGENCQWCTSYTGSEICSDFKANHSIEKTGANKEIIKDKWTWGMGKTFECFPRDADGIVIDCDMHPTSDGRVTWQHQMVKVSNNEFRCKICNRTCTKN